MAGTVKILVLGSGMVAPPCVEFLVRQPTNLVTVASRTGKGLGSAFPRTTPLALDVSDVAALDAQVAAHDLVISLVPFAHHAAVIESAIRGKTNVVTTSYVSPAMKQLEADVKKAGIVVLNEVGVDPGVDHLYAIKTIHEVHAKGGKIKESHSYCGGIPAPEYADNPLRMKFSWSPKGAILSQLNSASFLSQGEQVDIPSTELMSVAKPYHVMDGYSLEFYNIPEAETVVRGSLRYKGNPEFIQAFAGLGWLDPAHKSWLKEGMTWAEIQQHLVGASASDERSLVAGIKATYKFPDEDEADRIISGLREFGLLSPAPATIKDGNVLDTLCQQLTQLLSYKPRERDLVILQHKFVVEWESGKRDTLTSTLELLGDPDGYSAMALSVGITCGVAAQMLLDGHSTLREPGIYAPYTKEMCDAIGEAVAREGIVLKEAVL
ncbi:saccharopine dehydrogenase [Ophiocordyceps sinensis CO18]|uniref:Saccharopine dehydrogenase n=1 Tax=Ophiocordyceps sinensis (strain Co18 / CGMCC 3.14243) TaxID=911162 RepID=T5AJT8_OPHSC|nr:saccharopine dehydrogenase [Ophiocordyceps sinensis CO18]